MTLTEVQQSPTWLETAPLDSSTSNPVGACTATNFTVSCTLQPGDNVAAPNFGNQLQIPGTPPTVVKTANGSFNTTFKWTIDKTVDQPSVRTAGGAPATVTYTVTVSHDDGAVSNVKVTGTITVTNSNPAAIIIDSITDQLSDGTVCSVVDGLNVTIAAKDSVARDYTCLLNALPQGQLDNTATVSWSDQATLIDTGLFTLKGGSAPSTFPNIQFQNGVIDGCVNVTDTLGGSLGKVCVGDANPTTFTYSKTFTDPAGTCTTHDNTATFTTDTTSTTSSANQKVQDCQGANLTVSKTAAASFTRTYKWDINKSVDNANVKTAGGTAATVNYTVNAFETGFVDSGWLVTGTITVTNPNDWEAITATVTDAIDNGGSCTVSGGSSVIVPPSSSVPLDYTCTYASAPSPAAFTNTATATWDKVAASTTNSSASGTAGGAFGSPTKLVNQTITVTDKFNGGSPTTLGTLTATDTQPFASAKFTYFHSINATAGTCATFPNTATIVETGQTASQTVQDCQGADLTVSKTAVTAYNSNITKNVDNTRIEISGGTATFNYTVQATTSGWTVSGTITVTNPNNWESITASLADALSDSGGVCKVNGGVTSVTVAASSFTTVPYSCSFALVPSASSGTNTAKASWDGAAAHTPNSTATGTAGYAFASLTITDCFSAKGTTCTPNTLGTVTIPPGLATFKYSRSVPAPTGGTCQEYDNTATIVQTGQTASQQVNVCNTKTGGLTMGFWQNKNGQGIITGGASVSGVCKSGTFLRTFNPFQDLSATASCSAVATYVTNIIKAANASGASMNAMLKAQMLATALDVYFGGGGGGNPLGAPTPLANVKIDLTQVCIMIDSTSGTGSCSGKTENCAAAFGGSPTCQTVSALLTFAASQSNVGGSSWYGQNKTTQGLAKNTFDAINNQAAFICP